MVSITRFLQVEQVSEQVLKLKQYGKVSIYDAKGNLNARWYVFYSFRNPSTGKLEKQPNVYMNINDYNTVRDRTKAAKIWKEAIERLLKEGFNPYTSDLKLNSDKQKNEDKNILQAIDFTLSIGKSLWAESTYNDLKSRLSQLKKWLLSERLDALKTREVDHNILMNYLNYVLQKSSARNRNNTRAALSSMYNVLVANEYVRVNIVENINVLKSKPTKNKSYTTKQQEDIIDLLINNDPYLLLFIQFISVNLLRPIEVCRLTIGDIDIHDRVLKVRTKNETLKTKIIPEVMLQSLPDLTKYNNNDYLFTPTGPGASTTKEVNRRNYFSKRFEKVKKELGLGKEYGLYSFRHTYITKLYRELRKTYSPFEAKSKLMLITGHSSMDALEKYLRDIDAELPEDYSDLLK